MIPTRWPDDEDERRRDVVESPQERMKNTIIRLGEVVSWKQPKGQHKIHKIYKDPLQEISAVETSIRELAPPDICNLSESFHIGYVAYRILDIHFFLKLSQRNRTTLQNSILCRPAQTAA